MLLLSEPYSQTILFGLFTFAGFYIMPQVVDSLLDIMKTPRKPQYTMAPELPLILRSCLFDNVSFMCSSGMSLRSSVLGATFRKYFQPRNVEVFIVICTQSKMPISYFGLLPSGVYDLAAASSLLIYTVKIVRF
jgi:hypothetical protein